MNRQISKYSRDLISLLLISTLFFLPSIISLSFDNDITEPPFVLYVMPLVYLFVFLINYFYIINKTILCRRKILHFALINISMISILSFSIEAILSYLNSYDLMLPPPPPGNMHTHNAPAENFDLIIKPSSLIRDAIMMLLSSSFALALKLSNNTEKIYHKELEINAKQKEIELLSLKAQLNPHFLFNTLNNIYSLITFAPQKAQKAIHDLSSMLRFMIYESDSSKVPLKQELQFIQDYIELMKLRLNPSTQLSISIKNTGILNYSIAPLMFLTLIENAFKHGLGGNQTDFINIDIHMEESIISCTVENSMPKNKSDNSEHKGVGLENIRKQLSLIYPQKHSLDISKTGNSHKVILKINLKTD